MADSHSIVAQVSAVMFLVFLTQATTNTAMKEQGSYWKYLECQTQRAMDNIFLHPVRRLEFLDLRVPDRACKEYVRNWKPSLVGQPNDEIRLAWVLEPFRESVEPAITPSHLTPSCSMLKCGASTLVQSPPQRFRGWRDFQNRASKA